MPSKIEDFAFGASRSKSCASDAKRSVANGGDKASLDEKVERLKQQAEEEEALIRKAAAMLNNPRVVDTTVEQRIDFLRSKGLTASQERSSHAHEPPATQQSKVGFVAGVGSPSGVSPPGTAVPPAVTPAVMNL